jgi:hypothetical protein
MKQLNDILLEFRPCFSRKASFSWFVTLIIGLMVRTDTLGLTSVIRDLNIDPSSYETMIHFFYSKAWGLESVRTKWIHLVKKYAPLITVDGRYVLPADGVKQPKEARRMPGVKKLHQESGNSSKPEYIHGHMFGSIGILAGNKIKKFCIPLHTTLQEGVASAFEWKGNVDPTRLPSQVVQTVYNCYQVALEIGTSIAVMDRYYLSVPALCELIRLNDQHGKILQIVTKAKSSVVAYHQPPKRTGRRGRPRKKGESVKLMKLFETHAMHFQSVKVDYYGKQKTVKFYQTDLLWGQKLYMTLRFILVDVDGVKSILVSTDLTLSPKDIIELYGYRFKIESTFRELKQVIGGFGYRFWSRSLGKLNKYRKKDEPDALELVEADDKRLIVDKIRAIEMYVLCSNIALGLLQIMSLHMSDTLNIKNIRYLRTYSSAIASEATMATFIRKQVYLMFAQSDEFDLTQIIKSKQIHSLDQSVEQFRDIT